MTQPPDPPHEPPPRGVTDSILDRVFAYANTPWKAIAVIVAIVLAGVGWGLWQERDAVQAWLTAPPTAEAKLKTEAIPAALTTIATETTADIVGAFSFNMNENSAHLIAAKKRTGEEWTFVPPRLPIISKDSPVAGILSLMQPIPAPECLNIPIEPPRVAGVMVKHLENDGIKRICAVPIDRLGAFIIGWKAPLEEKIEENEVGYVREIATSMIGN